MAKGQTQRKGSAVSKRSSGKSKSRSPGGVKSVSTNTNIFICNKCTRPKSYLITKKEEKPKKEKPEKLDPSVICPIHGHIQLSFETEDITPKTQLRRIESHKQVAEFDNDVTIFVKKNNIASDSGDTESVLMSKKIRDSIEFTSMTNSAREPFNLVEMSEMDQEDFSEALISELKAIAEGKFELG